MGLPNPIEGAQGYFEDLVGVNDMPGNVVEPLEVGVFGRTVLFRTSQCWNTGDTDALSTHLFHIFSHQTLELPY